MKQTIPILTAAILTLGMMVVGCGGPARFVDPEADIPFYERVGILPFETLSNDRAAGMRLTSVFFTEVLNVEFAEVVEPGQFLAAINIVRPGTPVTNPWSTAEIARLSAEAGVQAVFMGTVREYEMTRVGRESFPLVSVEVRLVDSATGRLVWSASDTRRGGPGFPIFGWGEVHTLGELSADVCRDILETLP